MGALFIAFEGLPGAGKTTVIKMLKKELQANGKTVKIIDIETSNKALALRTVAESYPLGNLSRILLFWVLRLQQYDLFEKMRNEADIIFADRFWGSTVVIDVCGNGIPIEVANCFGKYIKKMPDITFFFDIPFEVAKHRKFQNTMKELDFARRVERGYKKFAKKFNWLCVDATEPPEAVKKHCMDIILPSLL